ncbi:MAG: hypothetical protein MJ240_00270 [Kiritimatiellae bacterium]|nr:hypothetical protein [Kiritimatiellia bacterium]
MKTSVLMMMGATLMCATTVLAATYTVEVDDAHTFESPLELANASVSVDGAEAVAFSTLLDGEGKFTASGTFVKTGPGFLVSSPAMANFTGEIRIAAGALIACAGGDLGPSVVSSAPLVTVSDGATLVFSTPKKCGFYNSLVLAGEGVSLAGKKMGVLCLNSAVHQQDYFFYAGWELTGDATFTSMTDMRMDIGDRTVKLNGHVLTFRPYDRKGGQICMSGTVVTPGVGGKIEIQGSCRLQSQANGTWNGDASNELVFNDSSYIGYYNNGVKAPWTMVWNTTGALSPGGTLGSTPGGWAKTNYLYWTGPVRIAGDMLKISGGETQRTYAFRGPVSGSGGIYCYASWLHLVDPANTFEGPVVVSDPGKRPSGLCLYNPGALPRNGHPTTITNAPLMMAANGAYALPALAYHVASGTNFSITGGSLGSSAESLRKTGAGRLTVAAPLAISDVLRLEEGTVTLPPVKGTLHSGVPGLWRGVLLPPCTNSAGDLVSLVTNASGAIVPPDGAYFDKTQPAFMDQPGTALSNEVVSCMDWMRQTSYPPWTQYGAVSWSGYVWNRSATNETWRFAQAVCGYSRFWLDGVRIQSSDDNGRVFFNDKLITPGPHRIVFKVCPRNYAGPGSIANPGLQSINGVSQGTGTKFYTWGPKMGFAIDFEGRGSTNVVDFTFPENADVGYVAGGDGSRFTRDARDTADFDAEELAAMVRSGVTYSNIVAKAGTTIDLGEGNEYPLPVRAFTGTTQVLNGSLRIVKAFNLVAVDNKASPLTVTDGKLLFDADAEISVDDGAGFGSEHGVPVVVARATAGIEGLPTPTANFLAARCRLAKSADGKELTVTVMPKGVILYLK